jgi:hypothetical protein
MQPVSSRRSARYCRFKFSRWADVKARRQAADEGVYVVKAVPWERGHVLHIVGEGATQTSDEDDTSAEDMVRDWLYLTKDQPPESFNIASTTWTAGMTRIDPRPEDDGCEFCQGGRAAFDGLPAEANPYPEPTIPKGQAGYYDDPHVLWSFGHASELAVPTGD